jgi:hypothetical protein
MQSQNCSAEKMQKKSMDSLPDLVGTRAVKMKREL